ncbi:PD40 domain-containing protein [Streptomyces sp. ADI96-02]|uniref:PD40 domain-containing protein n=1 Tax=Streptomyces sp. ADI96-02 TaxID=1522760 RepID=UPI000F558F2A|nr:PD40 domain-containing protein [Streptomyces sp. ADI96-02]
MKHGRSRDRRLRLMVLVAAVVTAVSGYAAGVTLLRTTDDRDTATGTELVSTGEGEGGAVGGRAVRISADGRHLVFQSRAELPSATPLFANFSGDRWRVYGRDRTTGAVTLLSDPRFDATDPQTSADGRVVTYRRGAALPEDRGGTGTVVVDRSVSGASALDRPGNVRATDLTTAPGPVPASFPALCDRDCGPRLSGDGSTVVYPSVLSPVSPDLVVSAAAGSATPRTIGGDMIDVNALAGRPGGFAPDDRPFDVTVSTRAAAHAGTDADLTGRPGLQGRQSGAFRTGTKKCGASGTCRTTLTFDPARCADRPVHWDRLDTRGATSSGRSSITLLARCAGNVPPPACGPGPDAGRLAELPLRRGEFSSSIKSDTSSDSVSGRRVDVGPVEPGRPFLVMVPARGLTGRVALSTQDCAAVRLVEPGPELRERAARAGAADPTPIAAGAVLDGSDSGTLYFLVDPAARPTGEAAADPASAARTYAARVVLSPAGAATPASDGFSVTVRAVRQVVEMRRDAKPGAGFAPGPATLVSLVKGRDASGSRTVDGSRPAVSGDGRTVVFTAHGLDPDAPPADAVVAARFADDGRHLSSTTVSGDTSDGSTADSPEVSSDGRTIVFVRRSDPAAPGEAAQVLVTDERGRGTRTLSTAASGAPGNADSTRPALSPDGRVVAFASSATNLDDASESRTGLQLFVRATGSRGSAVRLTGLGKAEDVGPYAAALDAGGSAVAFTTAESLAGDDGNERPDAYVRTVAGRLSLEPAALDFGTFAARSATGAGLPVRIVNTGPGPITVKSVEAGAPFSYRGACAGTTIRAGETCTAVVSFAPRAAGRHTGTLRVEAATAPAAGLKAELGLTARVEEPGRPGGEDGGGASEDPSSAPSPDPSADPSSDASSDPSADPSAEPPPGSTTAATLNITPTVAQPGRVLRVQGGGFAPNARVSLTWGATGPVQEAVATSEGTLTAYVPVAHQQGMGPASITASDESGRLLAYAAFLVESADG